MKNKYLILIILIVIIGTVFVVKKIKKPLIEPEITKEQVQQKFSESKQAYDIKLEQGYDLNEVLILEKQALQSYNKKNYDKAYKLLLQVKKILDRAEIPEEPIKQCSICNLPSDWSNCFDNKQTRTNYKCDASTNYQCQENTEEISCSEAKGKVILYENIINEKTTQKITGCTYGRSKEETIDLINKLNPEFVFRGLFLEPNFAKRDNFDTAVEDAGKMLSRIKAPVQGAVNLKGFYKYDKWSNGKTITNEEFNQMVLHNDDGSPMFAYGNTSDQYAADLTSKLYRNFIMDKIERFYDAGFEYMFFDEPLGSLKIIVINEMGGQKVTIENWDESERRLNELTKIYWKDIADRTHALGIKITTNTAGGWIAGGLGKNQGLNLKSPGPLPYLDIVTFNITLDENMLIGNDLQAIKEAINKEYGSDMWVMAFLDWGFSTDTAVGRFSALSPEKQSELIIYYVNEMNKYNIDFVIPIHGGWPGPKSGKPDYDFEACCKSFWCYDTKNTIFDLLK